MVPIVFEVLSAWNHKMVRFVENRPHSTHSKCFLMIGEKKHLAFDISSVICSYLVCFCLCLWAWKCAVSPLWAGFPWKRGFNHRSLFLLVITEVPVLFIRLRREVQTCECHETRQSKTHLWTESTSSVNRSQTTSLRCYFSRDRVLILPPINNTSDT